MNTTFYEFSRLSLSRGLVMVCVTSWQNSNTAPITRPDDVRGSQQRMFAMVFITCRWTGRSTPSSYHLFNYLFPLSPFLTLLPWLSLSLSRSPSHSQTCLERNTGSPDLRSAPRRTGTDRIAPHQPHHQHRSFSLSFSLLQTAYSPLLLGLVLLTRSYHLLHAHATPFHRLWHHKITT